MKRAVTVCAKFRNRGMKIYDSHFGVPFTVMRVINCRKARDGNELDAKQMPKSHVRIAYSEYRNCQLHECCPATGDGDVRQPILASVNQFAPGAGNWSGL